MWRRTSLFDSLRFVLLTLLTCLCLLSLAAHASAQATQASIVGRVVDESKAVLPGVTVTATSPALLVGQMTAVTDGDGEFRLTPLPIGTYTLTYTLQGFQTVRRDGVRLTAGLTARIDAELRVGQLEETVTVSGVTPVVDVKSTGAVTTLTRENIDLIPTARTGYNALLVQAPGVRENLQNISASGGVSFRAFGMSGQSWQATDGVVTANPKTTTQSGNYIDFSTIEESVISTLGHDASIPNRGVMLNAIVKSGTNEFHGGAYMSYTNSNFQSNNINAALAGEGIEAGNELSLKDDWNAELGGRLIRDKLWFFVSARTQRDRELELDCFQPNGQQCFQWQRGIYFTHKETWQINPSNRLTNMLMGNIRRDVEGASRLVAWERRTSQNGWNPVWKTEWQTVRGNALTMTLLYGGWMNHSGRFDEDAGNGKTPARDSFTRMAWGTAPNMNERNSEHRQNVRWNMDWYKPNWAAGDHEFKIGADYFQIQANRVRLERLAPQYQLVFRRGVADQIEINNSPVFPDAPINYFGAYVHDAWNVSSRLTLSLGIRYAYDNGKVAAACRDAAAPPGHIANPAECFPEVQFPIYKSWSPRTRFTYDITGDGRTLVKAGWGRYHKQRYTDELHTANRNVITTAIYRWRDLNGNDEYDDGEVNLDVDGSDFLTRTFSGQSGALANGIVNPDERQPYTDEYMLQFERELMANFGVRLTATHARALNQYRYENSLRPYETYTVPVTNPDPGLDGVVGTGDDPGTFMTYFEYPRELAGDAFQLPWIVNDPAANEKYTGFEIAASKRMSNRWQMLASYSATRTSDPLVWNVGGGTNFGATSKDPNGEIFAADNTWEWLGRLSGSYMMPLDVLLSGNFQHRSGNPWAREVELRGGRTIPRIVLRTEPIGARRLPNINLLDFRVEKQFQLTQGRRLSLRMILFNALNANTVTGIEERSGPNFGITTGILRPRLVDWAVQYTF